MASPHSRFGDLVRHLGAEPVLDIQTNLLGELAAEHEVATLSPAQFALQMIKAPQMQTFSRP
jgi:hypothetical protein